MERTIVVKTSAKEKVLSKMLNIASSETDCQIKLNNNFVFKKFGYHEFVFTDDTEVDNSVFQKIMRVLASRKVWVTCQNVTIVTKAGETTEKSVGARYNGIDPKMSCKGCKHEETCDARNSGVEKEFIFCPRMKPDYDYNRYANLCVDGADKYGFMRSGKTYLRHDSKRWFTDGLPNEKGELAFESEEWGHSECYSNFKHHNRKRFDLIFTEFDQKCLEQEPYARSVKKQKETFEPSSDDFSTLTGQALFDALNGDMKRPKNKMK